MEVLLIENDQTIKVLGVRDEISGEYQNTAVVTAEIKNKNGSTVSGVMTLEYVDDSDGDYRGNIDNDVPLVNNRSYIVEIIVTFDSFKGTWHFTRTAQFRQPED